MRVFGGDPADQRFDSTVVGLGANQLDHVHKPFEPFGNQIWNKGQHLLLDNGHKATLSLSGPCLGAQMLVQTDFQDGLGWQLEQLLSAARIQHAQNEIKV